MIQTYGRRGGVERAVSAIVKRFRAYGQCTKRRTKMKNDVKYEERFEHYKRTSENHKGGTCDKYIAGYYDGAMDMLDMIRNDVDKKVTE